MNKRSLFLLVILLLLLQGCVIPIPDGLIPSEMISTQEAPLQTITVSTPAVESPEQTVQVTEDLPPASPPTEEFVPTQTASDTATIAPTNPPPSTSTPRPVAPAPTPDTIIFRVQSGAPAYAPNVFHQDLGCNWMGVGGQVFGENGAPMLNLVVEVGGSLSGAKISMLKVTGTAPMYGEGGYEFMLSDRPQASDQTLWLQVFDLENTPLSEKIYFSTYDDCNLNMIIINFGLEPASEVFLPFIMK